MAEVVIEKDLQGFSGNMEALEAAIIKMQKNLSWILEHLDSQNVQSINTNQTAVESEDGATKLDGGQILMRDEEGRLRAVLGKGEDGVFSFRLYDINGREAIYLNEEGNAVFAGDICGANIEGTNMRIAPNQFRDYIALENDGTEDTIGFYYGGTRTAVMRLLDTGGLEIQSHYISLGASDGTVSVASGASGSFRSSDGKTVTVKKGIITQIL